MNFEQKYQQSIKDIRETVGQLKPGNNLNRLLAESMGWSKHQTDPNIWTQKDGTRRYLLPTYVGVQQDQKNLFDPSGKDESWAEVLKHMRTEGWDADWDTGIEGDVFVFRKKMPDGFQIESTCYFRHDMLIESIIVREVETLYLSYLEEVSSSEPIKIVKPIDTGFYEVYQNARLNYEAALALGWTPVLYANMFKDHLGHNRFTGAIASSTLPPHVPFRPTESLQSANAFVEKWCARNQYTRVYRDNGNLGYFEKEGTDILRGPVVQDPVKLVMAILALNSEQKTEDVVGDTYLSRRLFCEDPLFDKMFLRYRNLDLLSPDQIDARIYKDIYCRETPLPLPNEYRCPTRQSRACALLCSYVEGLGHVFLSPKENDYKVVRLSEKGSQLPFKAHAFMTPEMCMSLCKAVLSFFQDKDFDKNGFEVKEIDKIYNLAKDCVRKARSLLGEVSSSEIENAAFSYMFLTTSELDAEFSAEMNRRICQMEEEEKIHARIAWEVMDWEKVSLPKCTLFYDQNKVLRNPYYGDVSPDHPVAFHPTTQSSSLQEMIDRFDQLGKDLYLDIQNGQVTYSEVVDSIPKDPSLDKFDLSSLDTDSYMKICRSVLAWIDTLPPQVLEDEVCGEEDPNLVELDLCYREFPGITYRTLGNVETVKEDLGVITDNDERDLVETFMLENVSAQAIHNTQAMAVEEAADSEAMEILNTMLEVGHPPSQKIERNRFITWDVADLIQRFKDNQDKTPMMSTYIELLEMIHRHMEEIESEDMEYTPKSRK